MEKVIIIGLDLAKNVFQAHGAGADGSVAFRRKLSRSQVLPFFAKQSACLVAMEACASAHHWADDPSAIWATGFASFRRFMQSHSSRARRTIAPMPKR